MDLKERIEPLREEAVAMRRDLQFDFDEDVLMQGAELLARAAVRCLEG